MIFLKSSLLLFVSLGYCQDSFRIEEGLIGYGYYLNGQKVDEFSIDTIPSISSFFEKNPIRYQQYKSGVFYQELGGWISAVGLGVLFYSAYHGFREGGVNITLLSTGISLWVVAPVTSSYIAEKKIYTSLKEYEHRD